MKPMRLKHFKRTSVTVLFTALCLVLGTAATSVAAGVPQRTHPARPAGPPFGMSWRVYHLMMAQQPLDAAATKIQALAARPGPAQRGFFETKVDPSRGILTVYWHGPIPATVQHLISRLRATVNIQIVQTRYSLATLNHDVVAAIRSGRGVTSGYPMTDGSGIVLGVRSPNPRSIASIASALRSRFGVPVRATQAGPDHLRYCAAPAPPDPRRHLDASLGPGSRCNDWPAFWGGNVIQSKYVFCSGGFGVHNSSGGTYLITAAHCADNGSRFINGIAFHNGQDPAHWHFIGYITDVPGLHDLAVIPTSAGNRYYDGPGIWSPGGGDTYNTKIVAGQQATSLGDSFCESGAFGGVRCGFTVAVLEVSEIDPTHSYEMWSGLVGTTGNSAEDGDSGGPWFSLDGCCTHVWAKGIEHGPFQFGNAIYEGFTPITTATSDMGVWVNTG
jgi:hypothetical protein